MYRAQSGLTAAIEAIDLQNPAFPIIANSSGCPLNTAEEVRSELVDGLCHCVQWRNSVRFMVGSGVSQFVEFGPSRVLSSLIKRIDRDVAATTLSDMASIQKLSEDIVQDR
jgi:[acyl-carrier-protein] S-malonyltransferase